MQKYHRDLLEKRARPPPPLVLPPALRTEDANAKKIPTKRPKDRKSRRHRKIPAGVKGVDIEVKSFV